MSTGPAIPSNEQLAERAQSGCRQSFEELARRFQTPLRHFLRRIGGGEETDDLLQETFLRAYRNLDKYRSRWRFSTWIYTIARRTHISLGRKARPAVGEAGLDGVASTAPGPHQLAADGEQRQGLWDLAARALSQDELSAMWLFYVEEMPAREIAAVLERSWVSVKTMLFRARQRLREAVEGNARARRSPRAGRLMLSASAEAPHV